MTVLHPDGDNLDGMLHARTPRLTVQPYVESALCCAANVCRWRQFTAGYSVWLACRFNRQSLRSCQARGASTPARHMMPSRSNRRIIVMLHGLASSPETWVELANEILGDEACASITRSGRSTTDQHASRVEPP
jgi:hypothetical protein